MDPYPEIDSALWGYLDIALTKTCLDFLGAPKRIDRTGEFGKESVAHRLNDTTVMRSTTGLDQLNSDRPKPFDSALLVRPNQTRIADNVGGENCCETAGGGHSVHHGGPWLSLSQPWNLAQCPRT